MWLLSSIEHCLCLGSKVTKLYNFFGQALSRLLTLFVIIWSQFWWEWRSDDNDTGIRFNVRESKAIGEKEEKKGV